MKQLFALIFSVVLLSCSTTKKITTKQLRLTYLDEYVLSDTISIKNTSVGGLSGIDYHNGTYYLVCDDARNPRFYTAKIAIDQSIIKTVTIENVVLLNDTTHFFDLESIRYDATEDRVYLTSEGHINNGKNPLFFNTYNNGTVDQYFDIPKEFLANSKQQPRHNGTLEGLSKSIDGNGFWLGMELPLKVDGPEPKLTPTNSPVRISFIDKNTSKPTKQFAYKLDPIAKKPKKSFLVNGLTDILEYQKDKFLVIERSYSSGLGNQGNTVRIFDVDASKATNILQMNSLKELKYTPASKILVFDFEQIRNQLTDQSIDNIEGITFGPKLPNGNQTLLLISDNNFNRMEKQLNQFILLEMSIN